MSNKLILMCGVPGGGKSTYIKNHKAETDVVVSRDEIRFSMLKEEDDYFANENKVFAAFIDNIAFHLRHGQTVWADATHLTVKARFKVLNQIRGLADEIELIWIKVPIELAIGRNDQREGRARVPESAIENMYHTLQQPSYKEGFDKITVIEEEG